MGPFYEIQIGLTVLTQLLIECKLIIVIVIIHVIMLILLAFFLLIIF